MIIIVILIGLSTSYNAQQMADTLSVPQISKPYHSRQQGPKVFIDEQHNNFHTFNGRFRPFGMLMQNDGYRVNALHDFKILGKTDVLVISNAIAAENIGNWSRPIHNAFPEADIQFIKQWVADGGRLLLIADHMPFSGASNTLAQAFGFEFCDGFAKLDSAEGQPDVFSKSNARLLHTQITDGTFGQSIEGVTTFTGSSFQIPEEAIGILRFNKGDMCLQPEVAWQVDDQTIIDDLEGKYQGAIMSYGEGKLAVFGEAAQFTAQKITRQNQTFSIGFNSSLAPNNIIFIRNLMLWLSSN